MTSKWWQKVFLLIICLLMNVIIFPSHCNALSRVLPLGPLGHQAARYGAHLSLSLRAPAHHQMRPSPGVIASVPVSCLCIVCVSYFIYMLCWFIKTLTPWTCFPTLSVHRYSTLDEIFISACWRCIEKDAQSGIRPKWMFKTILWRNMQPMNI